MTNGSLRVIVRNTLATDFDAIIELCLKVYPDAPPWRKDQLASHLAVFPEGQLVAIDAESDELIGVAASLIILWADYDISDNWRDFTDQGFFTNHDPQGRTLYGSEVMVDPRMQGRGVGKALYARRRELVQRLGLLRIRAGARLRGYSRYAQTMTPEAYVIEVVKGRIWGPTLSFQLKQGFRVLGIVHDYLHADQESQGHAALIEWLNPDVASAGDYAAQPARFA